MSDPLKIAVAGLGTVGAGVLSLLQTHGGLIAERCGRSLQVAAVSARDRRKDRGVDISGLDWFDDPVAMAAADNIDLVVELIGGADGTAKAVVEAALAQGRHVVTANKALLAHHGQELATQAEAGGVGLGYEAAVAGGIPVIKALREGLSGNGIDRVYGILNGTCNYILTTMRETGRDFDGVLKEAQDLGYAEADPSFDIDGVDAAHKLALLTALAFGCRVDLDGVHVEGIRNVTSTDIAFAEQLGYRIKLLGISRRVNGKVEQRVHPCMVAGETAIARVEGVFNAVVAEGDFVGPVVAQGAGAGAGPTASAVVADIVDLARGLRLPVFGVPATKLAPLPSRPMVQHQGGYYLRLTCVDRPGVIADVAAALRDEEISVESLMQRGRDPHEAVPVVITTHETQEAGLRRALARIGQLDSVVEPPRLIRIETL